MKTRIVIGSLVATMATFQVLAQQSENDDMYFKKKDREKLKGENVSVPGDKSVNDKIDSDYNAFRKTHFDKNEAVVVAADSVNNPTDSFSARNVNPEYISRSNSEQASEDEKNYYVEGYGANNTDSYSANNYSSSNYNNYNNNYNNSNGYYGGNYGSNYGYGSSPYNSLYSPYYGSCNPWMSPYYGGSGLTMSMSYMWGGMYNSGWNYGMSYGYGNSYYSPYSNGYYSSGCSPYSNYGYPSNYYSGSSDSNTHYGKRPSRHSAVVTPTPRYTQHSSNTSGSSNGRTRQPVDEYYVKPFRRASTYENSSITSPSSTGSSHYSRPSMSDYPASRTRESYSSPTRESRSSTPSYSTPSRSSSSGSSPVRTSGGSSTTRKRD